MASVSALSPGRKGELHHTLGVVDAISWLLVVRIDVREPADTTSDDLLEVLAVLVEEDIIPMLVWDVRHSIWAVGLHAWGSD